MDSPPAKNKIPASVVKFAVAHEISVNRDQNGIYTIWKPGILERKNAFIVQTTTGAMHRLKSIARMSNDAQMIRGKNPVRPLAKRAGIRFYRQAGAKWLMFDPASYPAKTKNEALKIARALGKMFKTQIKVVIDK